MTNPRVTPPTLDHFEAGLLQELRAHVDTRAPEAAVEPEARRSHRRRWAAGFAVAAATATAVVIASPGGPGASPAYAISQDSDGDVVVTIHRLEDSAGLEDALRDAGIDAEVSFQPGDSGDLGITNYVDSEGNIGQGPPPTEGGSTDVQEDSAGGGPELESSGGAVTGVEPADGNEGPAPADCGWDRGDPATLRHEGDDWVLRIPADSPLQDRPVVIATGEGGDLMVSYPGNTPNSFCGVSTVG